MTDDDGNAESQDISVTVNQVNDAAIFGGDTTGTGAEDTTIIGTVTASDDPDGLTNPNFTVTGAASNGSATIDSTVERGFIHQIRTSMEQILYGNCD